MVDEYEFELEGSRNDVATALRDVADGLVAGSVRLGEGADAIGVEVPEELSLEIELETDDDEIELELEVEWPRPASGDDGISAFEAPPGEGTSASAGDSSDDVESSSDDTSADGDVRADADLPGDGDVPAAGEEVSSPVAAADESRRMAEFEVFRDRADEWRWRLRHRNGNVIATSGEGYTSKQNARKGLRSVVRNAPEAEITEETDD